MQVEITDIDARGKISLVPVAEGDAGGAGDGAEAPAEAAAPAGE
jgi:polyribonucleotide nucleotidyltransferase